LIDYLVPPGGGLTGRVRVPGDKSISHRAVILGSLAAGRSEISGLLEGEDVLATLAAFRAMGIQADGPENGRLTIRGNGMHGLRPPAAPLDMGNSGTAMRLMAGVLCAQGFNGSLIGDASLSRRPMSRIIQPLTQMGATISAADAGCPPLNIKGGQQLHGIDYQLPVASAQVKSAVLLAGLFAEGVTSVTEPAPARDHTERMLQGFGYAIDRQGPKCSLTGGGTLQPCQVDIPGDISSAAFFLVGATIARDSHITLQHVGVNPTRTGVINILQAMGADIRIENPRVVGGEPVADLQVRTAALQGIKVPADQVPLAIDEFPVLCVAAACAEGETVITGAAELRVKESDRIRAMATGLRGLGITVNETADGMIIQGGALRGGTVECFHDHRIAMAFAIAGLRAAGPIQIRDCSSVATSYPEFVEQAQAAGLDINIVNREP